MASHVKVMALCVTATDLKTGAGTGSTVTSSNPNAPGRSLKSNSKVVPALVAGTTNTRLVQPKAGRLVSA